MDPNLPSHETNNLPKVQNLWEVRLACPYNIPSRHSSSGSPAPRSRSSYFHVGGYQVCRKWLYARRGTKGRPGRTLTAEDIAHYQRIVVALKETMRLMEEIDAAIDVYGGWPSDACFHGQGSGGQVAGFW